MRPSRSPGWYWPWLLTLGLLATVTVNTVMLFAANSDRNGVAVEPDYYRKAVTWDSTLALQAESDRLGWRSEATLAREQGAEARTPSAGVVTLRLSDADGAAVTGAAVAGTLIHNSAPNDRITVPLKETEPGRYVAHSRLQYDGRWELRVVVARGSERFISILHPELASGPR